MVFSDFLLFMSYVLECVSFSLCLQQLSLPMSSCFLAEQKLHKGPGDSSTDTVQLPLNYLSHRAGNAGLMGVSGPALWHGDVCLL